MHTIDELKEKQSLPLDIKIQLTIARTRAWVNEYGMDGCYISFSGGKDSTVLMDIIRNKMGYNIPAMFVDVPTQFPELREFAKTWDNVEIVYPKLSFMEVCDKYGFPLISKEVGESIFKAKKYLNKLSVEEADQIFTTNVYNQKEIDYIKLSELLNYRMLNHIGGENKRLAVILGMFTNDKEHPIKAFCNKDEKSIFNQERYKFLLEAPFDVSNKCCHYLKKLPAYDYTKRTGRNPITAQMANESRLRLQTWLQNGCNGFNLKIPTSNPMSFWTENDVLQYIAENHLPICSVYGEVVEDFEAEGFLEGQITFEDFKNEKIYKTTGCKRTGCMLCGFGCHIKGDTRFSELKESHPKMYGLLDIVKNNNVTFRQAIEWTNEKGGLDIKL